jgi:hypothetical protein
MTDIVKRLPPLRPLPDCMMPDGAQPCVAFSNLEAEIVRLRTLKHEPRLNGPAELISECIANLGYPVGMGNPPSKFFCHQLAEELLKLFESRLGAGK